MEDRFRKMFAYDAWANALTFSSIREQGDAGPEARRLFAHIFGAQSIWYARLVGDEHPALGVWPELTIDQMGRYVTSQPARWSAYVDELDAADLEEPVAYRNTEGVEFATAAKDILEHVLLHSAYHRAQVAARLREVGLTPAVTDYIAYVRSRG